MRPLRSPLAKFAACAIFVAATAIAPAPGADTAAPEAAHPQQQPELSAHLYLPAAWKQSCAIDLRFVDVVLVVDTSESMGGTKLDALKMAATAFLDQLVLSAGEDQAALVAFAEQAETLQKLTHESKDLKAAIRELDQQAGRRIDRGLLAGLAAVLGPGHRSANLPVIVVLTELHERDWSFEAHGAAELVREAGVRLYVTADGGLADVPAVPADCDP